MAQIPKIKRGWRSEEVVVMMMMIWEAMRRPAEASCTVGAIVRLKRRLVVVAL
jgi:hypothetical protein